MPATAPDSRQSDRLKGNVFKAAMSCFATGVTVVTTLDSDGQPVGFTANSFCSASFQPPLILICLDRMANGYPAFVQCSLFAVSILRDHHIDVAQRFATKRTDKFDVASFTPTSHGMPAVDDALCVIICALERLFDAGDHVILLGRVIDVQVRDGSPMIYFSKSFRRLAEPG
jgi:flavin reductase ActVB